LRPVGKTDLILSDRNVCEIKVKIDERPVIWNCLAGGLSDFLTVGAVCCPSQGWPKIRILVRTCGRRDRTETPSLLCTLV
ncbi:MAG: hypothetical protein J2P17_07975, partial [Mycobacterium sp.]|nr:hypothetical protein [Mycobacterium sp.]